MNAHLLLLADSRLPAGGHVHSGGLEPAAAAGAVTDHAGLADFLHGRLATTGLVTAAIAAACTPPLSRVILQWVSTRSARSRREVGRPHHPVVLGAATAAAGGTPRQAAAIAAYGSVTGPASAADGCSASIRSRCTGHWPASPRTWMRPPPRRPRRRRRRAGR